MTAARPAPAPVVVLDSSALVALLTDDGADARWVTSSIGSSSLAAPAVAVFEAANVLRGLRLSGELDAVEAALAHGDLVALPIELWSYGAVAERAWDLRGSVTVYDASYVALAELLDAPLVTLDARLARAPGPRCRIMVPPP